LFATGKGVDQDLQKAVKWYRKAAGQGPEAQCNLGVMHRYGEEVAQDFKKAVIWFRTAANPENAEANKSLVTCTSAAMEYMYSACVTKYK